MSASASGVDEKSKVAIAGSHRTVCIRAQRGVLSPYKSNENKSPFKSPAVRKSSNSPFRTPQSTSQRSSGTPLSPRDVNRCGTLPTKSVVSVHAARSSGRPVSSKLPMLRESAMVSRQLKKQVEQFRQERQKLLNATTQPQQSDPSKTHADINSLRLKLEEYREQQRLVIRKRQEMLELNQQLLSCEQEAVDMSQRLTCVSTAAHTHAAHNDDAMAQQISGVLQDVEHQLLCDCLLSAEPSCSSCAVQSSDPTPNETVSTVIAASNVTDTNDGTTSSRILDESIQQVVSPPSVRVPQNTPFKSVSTSGSTLDTHFMQNLATQLNSVASNQSESTAATNAFAPQVGSKTGSLLSFETVLQRSGSGQDLFLTRSSSVSLQQSSESTSKPIQCCTPSRFSAENVQLVASGGPSRRDGRIRAACVVVAMIALLSACLFALLALPTTDSHMTSHMTISVNQFDQVIQDILADHDESDGSKLEPVREPLLEMVDVTVIEPLPKEEEVCEKDSVLIQLQSVHLEPIPGSLEDTTPSPQFVVESISSDPLDEPASQPPESLVTLCLILMAVAAAAALSSAVTKTVQRALSFSWKNPQKQNTQLTVDEAEESSQFGTFETFEIRRRRLSGGHNVPLSNAFVSPVRRSYRLKGKQTPVA
eukprot:GILK01002253.1.p1 GENE.GILK01002253.1~~GILK01002253.1.p1  ORF type:complete len:649 (+),score=128.75 GILK01002253.1:49-1995(+)